MLRREYGTFQLAPTGTAPGTTRAVTAAAWARSLWEQLSWWGAPLAVIGMIVCARHGRRSALDLALVAAPCLSIAVFILLCNLPADRMPYGQVVCRFWQQSDIFIFVWCGLGLAEIERRLKRDMTAVAAVGSLVLPVARFHALDRHDSELVRSYGAEILRAAPPGALLLTKGDVISNTVRYLQTVVGQRTDVSVADQSLLGFAWYRPKWIADHPEIRIPPGHYMPGVHDGFTMRELLDENYGRVPILICGGVRAGDLSADGTYGRWPFGLCEIMHSGTEPVNVDDWLRQSADALPRIEFARAVRPLGSWEDVVWSDYWEVRQSRAAQLLTIAGADPSRRRYIAIAAGILRDTIDENPGVPPHVYRNLAIALGREGLATAEQRADTAAAWTRYLRVVPESAPDRARVEAEIRRLTSGASE